MVPVLTGIGEQLKDKAGAPKSKTAPASSDLNITADEATNSLVITAQPNVMNSLEKVIDKLDIRRPQVLVEAIIAEVQDGNGWISACSGPASTAACSSAPPACQSARLKMAP